MQDLRQAFFTRWHVTPPPMFLRKPDPFCLSWWILSSHRIHFRKIEQYDIYVPEDKRTFPWFVCYDFEVMLQPVKDRPTELLEWTQKHVPISVSLCSNVEGYMDAICIVEENQDTLVEKMVNTLKEIANRVFETAETKWGWVLKAIDEQ